ncbi:MAG: LuxR C-terminal-related transcriptional regulator [Chloroflexota bacterium]
MNIPILGTKLQPPPVRPGFIPRPRLVARLAAGLHGRLTLVSAPAGFGKTTLLSAWAASLDQPLAWLSLDEGDNDPVRFLVYLVAALQCVDPGIGRTLESSLSSPPMLLASSPQAGTASAAESGLVTLLNDIDQAGRSLILVFDDYHLIRAAEIQRAVQFLLENRPPQLHLVISTRQDPSLHLSRWRARGQLSELHAPDLRFTPEEAASFLNQTLALQLSPQAIAAIEARTEGWAAGLQLAALALQESLSLQPAQDPQSFLAAFSGDDRHVMDYLVEEVLGQQPAQVQDFLLHTSILNRLSAPLCDALIFDLQLQNPSQHFLERLDATHLFLVPLDHKRHWYRYHHLFAELLRHHLQLKYPRRLAHLHQRASAWYEQDGDIDEAVNHALAIPDFSLAARLVEQHGSRMVFGGRAATFLQWIEVIPQAIVYNHAYICTDCAWAYALLGQEHSALRYVDAGEAALPAFETHFIASVNRPVHREEVQGDLTTIRAYCARASGDFANAIHYSRLALEQLPGDAYTVRSVISLNLGLLYTQDSDWPAAWEALAQANEMSLRSGENPYVTLSALVLQGNVRRNQGELSQAAVLYQQTIDLGSTVADLSATAPLCWAHLGLSETHYQRNQVEAAAPALEKAIGLAQQTGSPELLVGGLLGRARLALLTGNLIQAEADLRQARQRCQPQWAQFYEIELAVLSGELSLAQGRPETAIQQLAERQLPAVPPGVSAEDRKLLCPRLPEYLLGVRLLLAQGQAGPALESLAKLGLFLAACQFPDYAIQSHILQALASQLEKDMPAARRSLARALALAEPQGYLAPFLVCGKPMQHLLRYRSALPDPPAYAQQALVAFAAQAAHKDELILLTSSGARLYEPLTSQERRILRLLAGGLSSNQVAEELVIAVSTARSYIKAIYRKLDAHSRAQAIARGQELGLI